MTRIHVICEGQTEETFVNEVLAAPFALKQISLCSTLIGRSRHKGGNLKFDRLLYDVRARLLSDRSAYCTTFFDFYRLSDDFPGRKAAQSQLDISRKAACVSDELRAALLRHIDDEAMRRFVPYVQMYEFEGLLFSSPEKFAQGVGRLDLADDFRKIRDAFGSPEEINDSPETAPSNRVKKLYPGYEKPAGGTLAALEIGLDCIRESCRLFDAWLAKLEMLPKNG